MRGDYPGEVGWRTSHRLEKPASDPALLDRRGFGAQRLAAVPREGISPELTPQKTEARSRGACRLGGDRSATEFEAWRYARDVGSNCPA